MKLRLNNKLRYSLYAALACVFLSSCEKLHQSELKQENGTVIAKQYQGEINDVATGVGMSTSGNMVFTTHSIHSSAKYNVVFKCEHGVIFTINRAELYAKVNEGDEVFINYYEMLNEKGEVKDLDFVDANAR